VPAQEILSIYRFHFETLGLKAMYYMISFIFQFSRVFARGRDIVFYTMAHDFVFCFSNLTLEESVTSQPCYCNRVIFLHPLRGGWVGNTMNLVAMEYIKLSGLCHVSNHCFSAFQRDANLLSSLRIMCEMSIASSTAYYSESAIQHLLFKFLVFSGFLKVISSFLRPLRHLAVR
jgi:hypothetical protein